jgi:hypothetical protein
MLVVFKETADQSAFDALSGAMTQDIGARPRPHHLVKFQWFPCTQMDSMTNFVDASNVGKDEWNARRHKYLTVLLLTFSRAVSWGKFLKRSTNFDRLYKQLEVWTHPWTELVGGDLPSKQQTPAFRHEYTNVIRIVMGFYKLFSPVLVRGNNREAHRYEVSAEILEDIHFTLIHLGTLDRACPQSGRNYQTINATTLA